VGGNVSLYNEGATGPIYPTPVIGMVGRMPDARAAGRLGFQRAGDEIALVGAFAPSLDASELAKLRGQALPDGLSRADIEAVQATLVAVREAVRERAISSAHDIAEGGLAIALAECCLAGGVGAQIELGAGTGRGGDVEATGDVESLLFGEGSGGFVLSGPRAALDELGARVPVRRLGTVGGDVLSIELGEQQQRRSLAISLEQLASAHTSLAKLFS
jgi:phosphoribosylformylglycinamidine (FGAM) synthase-like enzyme